MPRHNKVRYSTEHDEKQAAKLAQIVRAAGFKPDHLHKKSRRYLENLIEVFHVTGNAAGYNSERQKVARLIVCELTGLRPWDYRSLEWQDPRVLRVTEALEKHNTYLAGIYNTTPSVNGTRRYPVTVPFADTKDELVGQGTEIDQAILTAPENIAEPAEEDDMPAAGQAPLVEKDIGPDTDPEMDIYLGMC